MNQKIFNSIAATIIAVLLSVNGYFLTRLVTSIDSLKEVTTELRIMIELHKGSTQNHSTTLKEHSDKIKILEQDFAIHKVNKDAHSNN